MGGWDTPVSWGGFGDVRMNVLGTEGVLNLNFTPMDLYAARVMAGNCRTRATGRRW